MIKLIKAELLKHNHSFHKKLTWIAPLMTLVLAFLLMGGSYIQTASYNWWYILILPSTLTMIIGAVLNKDKIKQFQGIFSLSIKKQTFWYVKIIICLIYLSELSLIFFIGVTCFGWLLGTQIQLVHSFFASLVIIVLIAWQIPLWMFMTLKLNNSIVMILSLLCNFGLAVIFAIGSFWYMPFAIVARVMCPLLGILPNGLLVEVNSPLLDKSVVIIGLVITMVLFISLSLITAKAFEKTEVTS